ncbi:MAG: ECF transporter S component [Candidatus Limnocylindrales bacterium]
MTATTMDRGSMWSVSSRTIVYAAIGAALYGVLVSIQVPIPGTTAVSVRPAFALVPFFGYAFGPIVGLFTGLVGNMIGDQLSGWGLLTSWNWSIANGLVGLLAGLAPMYLASMAAKNVMNKAIAGAIGGAIAVVVGFLFVFTDVVKDQMDVSAVLGQEYIPVVIADLIATIILVPVLIYAWEPVKGRLGR